MSEQGEHPVAETAAAHPAREETARLLARDGAPRGLLRQRVEIFVILGVALGALHLAAGRTGGDHIALTALLGALVPVFAPVCFVPAVFTGRERGAAGRTIAMTRVATVAALGWLVAGVHLVVWEGLARTSGSIGGPSIGDIPFMLVTVSVTAVVATLAYEWPITDRLAQPVTVAAVVVLYVGSFVVHGTVLTPSLSAVHQKLSAGPMAIEVIGTLVALVAVWLLMRREVMAAAHEKSPHRVHKAGAA